MAGWIVRRPDDDETKKKEQQQLAAVKQEYNKAFQQALRPAGTTKTASPTEQAKTVLAKQSALQPNKKVGIMPRAQLQPLQKAPKTAQTLPGISQQTLEKAQQIGQRAQGKTAEQIKAQNLQNIKEKMSGADARIKLENAMYNEFEPNMARALGTVASIPQETYLALGALGTTGIEKVAGIAGENAVSRWAKDQAEKYANTKTIAERTREMVAERYPNQSKLGQGVGDLTEMVTRVLAMLGLGQGAAAAAGAGAGLGSASIAPQITKTIMGLTAGHNGMREALREGATKDQAVLYGTTIGMLEAEIESMFGGIAGLGEGVLDDVVKAMWESPALHTLIDIYGEIGEEEISLYLTPLIKRAIYDKGAEMPTIAEAIETAGMTILATSLLKGATGDLNLQMKTEQEGRLMPEAGENAKAAALAGALAENAEPGWVKNIAESQQTEYNGAGGVENGQAGVQQEDSKYRSDPDGWWNEQKSGTKLRTYDYPEGRFAETKASPEFWGKDAAGKPITLYHSSNAENIDRFIPGAKDIGTHAGSIGQANDIGGEWMYELEGEIESPLYVAVDIFGQQEGRGYFEDLYETADLSPAEIEYIKNHSEAFARNDSLVIDKVMGEIEQAGIIPTDEEFATMMIKERNRALEADLLALGYDTLVYHNDFENKGLSYAFLDPGKIKIKNKYRRNGTTDNTGGFVMPENKRPASLRQRVAQQSVPNMEDRANSAKAAIDSGAGDDVVKMLQTEDDGMVLAAQSDLSDVAEAIQGAKAGTTLDISRMLDAVAKGNPPLRQRLYEAVEKPLIEAKAGYTRNTIDRLETYKADMDRLGIKVGSKESAAVQWYGEKQRQTGVDNETIPYSLEQLQQEFPETWQNIVEAEKIHRQMYDEYVKRINAALELIYPQMEAKAAEELGIAKADIDHALWELAMQEKLVKDLQTQAEVLATQMRSNNLAEATRAKQELAKLQKDIAAEKKHAEKLSERAEKAAEKHRNLEAEINSGKYFRGKRLMPRKDYFHHFVEMEEVGTIKGLRNMLNRPGDIAPELVSVSEFTKPKSKFSGWLQRRTGAAYTEDAVAGMARYIPMAEYKINIEPYIAQMRGMVKSVVDGTKTTRNANGFIDYMTQFTNDLAGKTHKIDRAFQSEKTRKAIKVLEWLNNRAAANAVVGNLGSAIVQISNIPNATTYVTNPRAWVQAMSSMAQRGKTNALLAQSPFLAERYITNTTDLFSKKTPVRKFAEGMMEIGDREASKMIWLAAYNQYEDAGGKVKGQRQYENAVDYADDITRRSVAGRGVGEMPPLLKSKVIKMVAPFQVEVNNSFNVLKEQMGEKNAAGLLSYCISAWVTNSLIEQITGRRVVFDPIQAIIEAIELAKGDEEEEGNILSAFVRLAGEVISNIPGVAAIAPVIFDTDDMEKIFGEQNPTKYGTGILATSPIGGAAASIVKGKAPNITEIATTYLTPYGGAQIERGVKAAQAFGVLPALTQNKEGIKLERRTVPGSYTDSGRLRFEIEPNARNVLTTAALGEYATPEGREYIESGKQPMSEKYTQIVTKAAKKGINANTVTWIIRNKGTTQKEATKAINQALGLTKQQKAWLWKEVTGGAEKNNPFK